MDNEEEFSVKPAKQEDISFLDNFEKIIALANVNKLGEVFFENAKPYLELVALVLGITEVQAALFSLVLEHSDGEFVSIGTIAKAMNCGRIQILKYMDDFEALENKNLIKAGKDLFHSQLQSSGLPGYYVPLNVIKALRAGRRYRNKTYCGLGPQEFFDAAKEIFTAFRNNNVSRHYLYNEFSTLFESNSKSAFVRSLMSFGLNKKNTILLLAFCCAWLEKDTENVSLSCLRSIFGFVEIRQLEKLFKTGNHQLIKDDFIANGNDDGMADTETWTITKKTRETFLSDLNIKEKKQQDRENNIKASAIRECQMFYPMGLSSRINELIKLLTEDNFVSIKQRLADRRMPTAFTILFQGYSGTGKTESAYQIARLTGRDICTVDISETKSQWFGESEKRIKAVFDRYKNMIKHAALTPILLFNEADAVLCKRQEFSEIRRGPAQTENAIQNIILQEMENLNGGILVATTNMALNLDRAFERRFLYKIEFEKPDQKARSAIWRSRLPELIPGDADTLSLRYDFSGGQIDNIARKHTINTILNGSTLTLDGLAALCDDELTDKAAKHIGFCVN